MTADQEVDPDAPGSSIKPYVRSPRGGRPDENDPRRCTGHLSDGSGERCWKWAIKGHHVCPDHGGSLKSVKRQAQLNLLDLLPMATKRHKEILRTTTDERVALKAAEMVYDRTGLEAKAGLSDVTVVREMLVGRLLGLRGEEAVGPEPGEEEVFEAEIVDDDEEGLSMEDLI